MAGGGLAIILGKGKPTKGKPSPMGDNDGDEGGEARSYDEYADDLFDAIQSGDRKAFRSALEKCIENC